MLVAERAVESDGVIDREYEVIAGERVYVVARIVVLKKPKRFGLLVCGKC